MIVAFEFHRRIVLGIIPSVFDVSKNTRKYSSNTFFYTSADILKYV